MAGTSAAYLAARLDHEIRKRGQAVDIYRPARTVTSGRPADGPVTLAGSTTALFEFSQAAQDMAMGLGVDAGQVAEVYIVSTDAALLTERAWVRDAAGRPWLVQSRPNAQPLEGTTLGVNAFLRWSPDKPAGMP